MAYLLHHQFCETAKKFPDKEAVIFKDRSISYKDLDEITNKLANIIQKKGIERGDRIGIYMPKSIDSMISILGILKAGAVYVPLDPNAPFKRLAYIIKNCEIKCLIAATEKARDIINKFENNNPLNLIIMIDNDNVIEKSKLDIITKKNILAQRENNLPPNKTIDTDLAYILYTSGSTGDPKGVMISHLNALTFVNWAYNVFVPKAKDRLSNHAPLHFDLSIFDIFVAFKAGAALLPVPEEASSFPFYLAEWIRVNKISIWYSVPSILSMLVTNGKLSRFEFKNLHTIIFAGEVFPIKYLRELMKEIKHAEYYNLYGPTETNVITYFKVDNISEQEVKPIPIGKPCENMEVFAIRKKGGLVKEPGQEGELFARGSCVAKGYWADDKKTKESFIQNKFCKEFKDTIYKTGDLVTINKDGNYIYIGRRDHMIKSRGYRIEIGEIEAALYSHENVKEAAVIAIPDELIGNRIKAFIVKDGNNSITESDAKRYCSTILPKYMVPEEIEFLKKLPKTTTGKIDKKRLGKQNNI